VGYLVPVCFTLPYGGDTGLSRFPGGVFGGLRHLRGSPSLFGLQLGVRFLLMIIFCGGGMSWLGGAVCVVGLGKQWIIFYYIALEWRGCGVMFSSLLGVKWVLYMSGYGSFVCVEELVWETILFSLEPCPCMFVVDYLERTQAAYF
jgi:hypothetical protein